MNDPDMLRRTILHRRYGTHINWAALAWMLPCAVFALALLGVALHGLAGLL